MQKPLKTLCLSNKFMDKNILFRAIIEVVGSPAEHVENTIKGYVKNLHENSRYQIIREEFGSPEKPQGQELWASFAELEVRTEKVENIVSFCFEYMPSLIEVLEPQMLQFSDVEVSLFLNDLQARLHQLGMLTKNMKLENENLKKNFGGLLKNYITVLLGKSNLSSEQLSKLTGIKQEMLEDFLDQLIDEGRIDLKEGIYFLRGKEN